MDPAAHPISEVITLSVAPVFLLVAIGGLLNVMTQRLARIVDRARLLEMEMSAAGPDGDREPHRDELRVLDKRMGYTSWAINFCSVAALLIAFVVALLFISDLAEADASQAVAVLFILAMAAIVAGLCAFLVEVATATRTVRVWTKRRAAE